jgi:4-hydroxythreonine-4-phosphate dehydrogenase
MRIIITCGDPNGIGLELLFRAMSHAQLAFDGVELALCAPPAIVRAYAEVLVRAGCIEPVHVGEASVSVGSSILPLLPIEGSADALQLGTPTRQSGMVAMAALECAARAVLAGECDAVVTLPVSKHALSAAGFPFPGQTEFWGSVAGANPLMILACSELRVALVTIHEPLARVAELITLEREIETIERFHRALAVDFAVQSPTIAVLGLNPHAGEHGLLGQEEDAVIAPAIEHLQERGIRAEGPFPADSFFARGHWQRFSGVVAQYHDQGLIPLKMIARGRGVNVTAGLPFVRTSPDHGTAYDIAGQCRANYQSLLEAISMAQYLATNRKRSSMHVSPTPAR